MATEPLDKILYRELARVEAKDAIDVASPLLTELVNYSTNAFTRCLDSAQRKDDEYLAILSLYWHIIEMTDGIEILIAQSAPVPALPLLRSLFEALISMEYILQDPSKYTVRSVAWLAGYYKQRLVTHERLDPSTVRGKEYQSAVAQDAWIHKVPSLDQAAIQPVLAFYRNKLAQSPLKEMDKEFLTQKRSGGKKIQKWYQLFGGPDTLEQLAKVVGRGGQYQLFYRYWSGVSHAEDVVPLLGDAATGQETLKRLRAPKSIPLVSQYTAGMMLRAIMGVIEKFRPGEMESLATWYARDVRELFLVASNSNRDDQRRRSGSD